MATLPQEQPLYVLPQVKKRAILPTFLAYLVLGTVFYFGVLLNLALLKLTGEEETIVKTISLILLLSVMVLGMFLNWHKANFPLKIFPDRITQGGKEIPYSKIAFIQPHQNFADRIFNTYSIRLNQKLILNNLPETMPPQQLQEYLQQMQQYAAQITSGSPGTL